MSNTVEGKKRGFFGFIIYFIVKIKEDDILATVNDLTFVMEPSLVDNFGGFMFLSSEENEGQGLALKPLLTPIIEEDGCDGSCCSSCGGGCH